MIDRMTIGDAEAAGALSASLGWPHRMEDWRAFLGVGQGFAWREDGRLAGTAMWFPFGADHGSIGLVQVAAALQGRGIGGRLMQAAMEAAGERSLILHSTPQGAKLYARLGFERRDIIEQWQGISAGPAAHAEVRDATPEDRAGWAALDHEATGLSRGALIEALGEGAPAVVLGGTDGLRGFAMRRRFGRGQHIGPVIARDEHEAAALVGGLQAPGFLRLDIPAGATVLAGHLVAAGLACVDLVQVMVRGPWPEPAGPARRFGMLSQALS